MVIPISMILVMICSGNIPQVQNIWRRTEMVFSEIVNSIGITSGHYECTSTPISHIFFSQERTCKINVYP